MGQSQAILTLLDVMGNVAGQRVDGYTLCYAGKCLMKHLFLCLIPLYQPVLRGL